MPKKKKPQGEAAETTMPDTGIFSAALTIGPSNNSLVPVEEPVETQSSTPTLYLKADGLQFVLPDPIPGDPVTADSLLHPPVPKLVAEIVTYTSQEMDALERAAADGKSGNGYVNDPEMGRRRHQVIASHYVSVDLTEDEKRIGHDVEDLQRLTEQQDADTIISLLYITNALMPPPSPDILGESRPPLPTPRFMDLNDLAQKLDNRWHKLKVSEKQALRRKAWAHIQFGARARVVGQRSIKYYDEVTQKVIDTQVDTPLWMIGGRMMPKQSPLPPFPQDEIPLRFEITAATIWYQLMTRAETAQYLPLGELLTSVPGNQPSGAWARSIMLALASLWRIKPQEAIAGTRSISRDHLLNRYQSKYPVNDILYSEHPRRAVQYWVQALDILVAEGFIAPTGEAAPGVAAQRIGKNGSSNRKRGWEKDWIEHQVVLSPGPRMRDSVERCARNLPPPRTHTKTITEKVAGRKVGRPSKSAKSQNLDTDG